MSVTPLDPPRVWTFVRQDDNGTAESESSRTKLIEDIRDASKTVLVNIVSQLQGAAETSTTKNMPVLFPNGIGLISVDLKLGLKPLDMVAGLAFTVEGVKDFPARTAANQPPSISNPGRG